MPTDQMLDKGHDRQPVPKFNYRRATGLFITALLLMGCAATELTTQSAKTPQSTVTPPVMPTKPPSTETALSELNEYALPRVMLGLMGDLSLGRKVNQWAHDNSDFDLFDDELIAEFLQANDINVANLESTIIGNNESGVALCPISGSGNLMILCGSPEFVPQLARHKFIFNLANNHINDFDFADGEQRTTAALAAESIPFYNSHNAENEFTVQKINGIKIGFLGFDFINHFSGHDEESKNEAIEKIKKHQDQVDYLVVSVHWGQEYETEASSTQKDFAHAFIDAGADIIHGTHPHVVQPLEIYNGRLITYSLGNFTFDQDWSEATSHSVVYQVIVSKDKMLTVVEYQIEIESNGHPRIISPPTVVYELE